MDALLLVVESTAAMQLAAERSLPNACRVIGASSIREALAIVRNERVAAVLVDARLSDGSGFDVVRAVRDHHGLVPVLIATSVVCRDEINDAQQLRAAILARPFPDSYLEDFVRASFSTHVDSHDDDRIHAAIMRVAAQYGLDELGVAVARPRGAGQKTLN